MPGPTIRPTVQHDQDAATSQAGSADSLITEAVATLGLYAAGAASVPRDRLYDPTVTSPYPGVRARDPAALRDAGAEYL